MELLSFQKKLFRHLAYSMASIDSLVKSATYLRTEHRVNSFLARKVQEHFTCKTALFRATTKAEVLILVWFDSFVTALLMELDPYLCLFQNRIPGSLRHLTLTPFRQSKRQRNYKEIKVAYEPGLDNLLECFSRVRLPESSAFCSKNYKNFWNWGRSWAGNDCSLSGFEQPRLRVRHWFFRAIAVRSVKILYDDLHDIAQQCWL